MFILKSKHVFLQRYYCMCTCVLFKWNYRIIDSWSLRFLFCIWLIILCSAVRHVMLLLLSSPCPSLVDWICIADDCSWEVPSGLSPNFSATQSKMCASCLILRTIRCLSGQVICIEGRPNYLKELKRIDMHVWSWGATQSILCWVLWSESQQARTCRFNE